MKLSTKGRYGVRFMLDLAQHYGKGPVLLKEIAARQQISEKYLWQLTTPLKSAGLISAVRGARGGFELTRHPDKISLKEILVQLEGPLSLVECVDKPSGCQRSDFCVTIDIWREISDLINSVLDSYSLSDLLERQNSKLQTIHYSI